MSTNLLFPDIPRFDNDPRDWDWGWAVEACRETEIAEEDCEHFHALFMGSVQAIYPSGKYWTIFANGNVSDEEAEQDMVYGELLEACASEAGGWIENGEGDPCDLFFCLPAHDSEELDESMDGDHESALASAGFGTDEDYGGCDDRL